MEQTNSIQLANTNEIIMVDDDQLERAAFERIYQRSSLTNQLILLNSGEDLVAYMNSVEKDLKPLPALIFCDCHLLKMDGNQATKIIRERPKFSSNPPIVILSHSSHEKDRQESLVAGANLFQQKPKNIHEFVGFLDSLSKNL